MNTVYSRFYLSKMQLRDPNELERQSSTLDLFFDLVFVIAVSIAASSLHKAMSAEKVISGIEIYLMIFFAIWWAWMNFTWFSSSFFIDDWLYRVLTFIQMVGVLVLAAGIEPMFENNNLSWIVYGYVIMRLCMVTQWVRAAISNQSIRRTATTYAIGIAALQVLWILLLFAPTNTQFVLAIILILGEISVPIIAEKKG